MKKLIFLVSLLSIGHFIYAQNAGNCMNFNGTEYPSGGNPSFEAANNTSFDLTKQVTVEAWIKLPNPEQNQKIAGKTTSDFGGGYMLGVDNGGLYPEVWDAQANNYTFYAGEIPANEWTHIAITWSGGDYYRGYVNGVIVHEEEVPNQVIGTNPNSFIIGAAPWDQNYFGTNGCIDNLRLWSEALDSATINQWMHKEITELHPFYNNLICEYLFNENSSYSLTDNGPNGNDAAGSSSSMSSLWTIANYPFASDSECLTDVEGVWEIWTINTSDELEISDLDIDDENGIVFGNNNKTLSFIPSGTPEGISLISEKAWRIETINNISYDLTIDLSDINIENIDTLYLIGSSDYNFSIADTLIKGVLNENVFTFNDLTITNDITFFCIGAYVEGLVPEVIFENAMSQSLLDVTPESQTFDPSTANCIINTERIFAEFELGMPAEYLNDMRFVFSENLPPQSSLELEIDGTTYTYDIETNDAGFWLSEILDQPRENLIDMSGIIENSTLKIINMPEGEYTLSVYNIACESNPEFAVPTFWNLFGADTVQITADIETNISDKNDATISLYPNPATDIINIKGRLIDKIEIIDILGNIILTEENDKTIDVSKLNSGIYIVRLHSNNKLIEKRLTIK